MRRGLTKAFAFLVFTLLMGMLFGPAASAELVLHPNETEDIAKVSLIEEGFIEIIWKNRMDYPDTLAALVNPSSYYVTLNGTPVEIASVHHWDNPWPKEDDPSTPNENEAAVPTVFMTSLRIKDWQDKFNYDELNAGLYESATEPVKLWNNTDKKYTDDTVTYDKYNGGAKDVALTLEIVGDIQYHDDPAFAKKSDVYTYEVKYVPFFKQIAYVYGLPIASSFNSSVNNLRKAQIIGEVMLRKANVMGVVDAMKRNRFMWAFHGTGENSYFLPASRIVTVYAGNPSGGGGATPQIPAMYVSGTSMVNMGEGNTVDLDEDGKAETNETIQEFSSGTFAHETGHSVHLMGVNFLENSPIPAELSQVVIDIFSQGYYMGDGTGDNTQFCTWNEDQQRWVSVFDYMLSSTNEIFSTISEIWFNIMRTNDERPTGRDALQVYHPEMFALLNKFYPQEDIPGISQAVTSAYRTPFAKRYLPNRGEGDDFSEKEYVLFNASLGANENRYFKILNYTNANVITYGGRTNTYGYEGDPATAWWDWSNNSWNYNFDLLCWVVKPVEINGVTYYQFLQKGWDDLNVAASGTGIPADATISRHQFGEDGKSGVFTTSPLAAGRGGLALGVVAGENVVGGNVRAVRSNLTDDNQLWKLVGYQGRYSQIVNKASGLAISGVVGAIPGDGVPLVLVAQSMKPEIGAIWRVIQTKLLPSGRVGDSILDDAYAVVPTIEDVQMKEVWLDDEDYINIVWSEAVDDAVAGNVENYVVKVSVEAASQLSSVRAVTETIIELDQEQSYSEGDLTMLKLADEPSDELKSGVGVTITFTGEMAGEASDMQVNNARPYNFKAVEEAPAPAPSGSGGGCNATGAGMAGVLLLAAAFMGKGKK